MEDESTLKKINSEEHVNDTISRDEENPGTTALQAAEELICQLPASHTGRNDWLLKYGQSEEAEKVRRETPPSNA